MRRDPSERKRHLRLAKPALVLLLVGFAAGPVSMMWLRGEAPFATLHALAGSLAAGLFAAAAWVGRRLERGASRAFDVHAWLALAAMLAGALAAVAGFVLLP